MEILLSIVFMIVAFKPMDRFIRGKSDLMDDDFKLVRGMLIVFFLLMFSLMIIYLTEYVETSNPDPLEDAWFVGILLVIYTLILWAFRNLYHSRYREDAQSFNYRSIFRNHNVRFDELRRVKYYRSGRGGSGYRLQTFGGAKYTLPNGFFNKLNLEKYIKLNACENVQQRANRWVELLDQRQSVPTHPHPEQHALWMRLTSRLQSETYRLFPARIAHHVNGVVQRPSRIYLIPIVLLAIPMVLMLLIMANEWYRYLGQHVGDIWGPVSTTVVWVFFGWILFRQWKKYGRVSYYEDYQQFTYQQGNRRVMMAFDEIEAVIVQPYKIVLQTAETSFSKESTVHTNAVYPKQLVEYLTKHFKIESERFGDTIYLQRDSSFTT